MDAKSCHTGLRIALYDSATPSSTGHTPTRSFLSPPWARNLEAEVLKNGKAEAQLESLQRLRKADPEACIRLVESGQIGMNEHVLSEYIKALVRVSKRSTWY